MYISAENEEIIENDEYLDALTLIIKRAQILNHHNNHFPVVAIGYGYLATVACIPTSLPEMFE